MSAAHHVAAAHGLGKLAFDAVEQVTGIVEGMHRNFSPAQTVLAPTQQHRTGGITGLVYRCIQGINGGLRLGFDAALTPLQLLDGRGDASTAEETARAILNGVVGDHLESSDNPLALPMRWRAKGQYLQPRRDALLRPLPDATGKLLIVVHGLCMNDLQWTQHGHNHAEAMAKDHGYTPVYLHYNSGRHISTNGREFAQQLERLIAAWPVPVESLSMLTHSMGGLVARSACHYAQTGGLQWPRLLRRLVFLGTPHHGAPLERHGNQLQRLIGLAPFASPLARLGMLRSAGVTDLRYSSLVDEDWQDRGRFEHAQDERCVVPLPENVECFFAAATTGLTAGDLKDRWLGDGLVPLRSALGQHCEPGRCLNPPADRQWIGYGMNHWALLHRPEVYQQLQRWLG